MSSPENNPVRHSASEQTPGTLDGTSAFELDYPLHFVRDGAEPQFGSQRGSGEGFYSPEDTHKVLKQQRRDVWEESGFIPPMAGGRPEPEDQSEEEQARIERALEELAKVRFVPVEDLDHDEIKRQSIEWEQRLRKMDERRIARTEGISEVKDNAPEHPVDSQSSHATQTENPHNTESETGKVCDEI